jgi:hypothetical protein
MSVAGYINDQDRASLILHHGEITAEDLPFGKKANPFRIALLFKPTGDATFGPALLDLQLIGDVEPSAFPVDDLRDYDLANKVPIWSIKNIVFIDDTQNAHELLENYRLFWSSGDPSPLD